LGAALVIIGIYIVVNLSSLRGMIPGIIISLIGVLIFPWIIEMQFDKEKTKLKKLLKVGPIRVSIESFDICDIESVSLDLFSQNQRMNNLSQTTNVKTRTYDITVHTKKQNILVSDSTDYDKSLQILEELGELLDVEAENKFEKMKAQLQERRQSKG